MSEEKSSQLERIVKFEAGYDCINFECKFGSKDCRPDSGGSHGVHGLQIRFIVKGAEGAVQFLLYTDWMPQATGKFPRKWGGAYTMPADLGWHSKTPRYDGQTVIDEHCEFCDGQPCYYDGSGLNATDAMYALVNGGDEGLWKFLSKYYSSVFEDGDYPEQVKYPMAIRKDNQ